MLDMFCHKLNGYLRIKTVREVWAAFKFVILLAAITTSDFVFARNDPMTIHEALITF